MMDASYLLDKYPGRIPVIINKKVNDPLDDLDKNKYLIPSDMIFWQFLCILRKRLHLPANKALSDYPKLAPTVTICRCCSKSPCARMCAD